jgi:hypothetical protein
VLRESSHAVLWGSSHAELWGSSHAVLWGSSHAVLRESSHAVLRESSHAELRESSHAELRESSHAELRESSHAELWGSSHAVLWGSSHAVLRESSHAVASGSSNVHLRDNSKATVGKLVSVHLYSQRATFEGGVLIDLTGIDLSDPTQWAEYHGVKIEDDKLLVYKAVNSELTSDHGMEYPLGEIVTAPDWDGQDRCAGGLHFGPTPRHALEYHSGRADVRFLLCAVPADATVGITDQYATPKCKARECVVISEVDIDGKAIAEAVSA